MPKIAKPKPDSSPLASLAPRRRAILEAAYQVLMERGYAGASTLEIATRARVSKRELYAEFGNKSGILRALIAATATRMQLPLATAEIRDRADLAAALEALRHDGARRTHQPARDRHQSPGRRRSRTVERDGRHP